MEVRRESWDSLDQQSCSQDNISFDLGEFLFTNDLVSVHLAWGRRRVGLRASCFLAIQIEFGATEKTLRPRRVDLGLACGCALNAKARLQCPHTQLGHQMPSLQ